MTERGLVSSAREYLLRAGRSRLAGSFAWTVFGQAASWGIRAAYFLILVRTLPAREYGLFLSVSAMMTALHPFADLGTTNLILKDTARDPASLPEALGNALAATFAASAAFILLLMALAPRIFPASVSPGTVAMVAVADILCMRLAFVLPTVFQAHDRIREMNALSTVFFACKLAAAVLFMATAPRADARTWAGFYLAGSALPIAAACVYTLMQFGRPSFSLARLRGGLGEGFHFSLASSAGNLTGDVDKTMLAKLSSLEAGGAYGVASRIIEFAAMPINALSVASYGRFFQHGARGARGGMDYAVRLLPPSILFGSACSAGLFLGAPLLPLILGPGYAESVQILRWLSPLPLLRSVSAFPGNALSGSGLQSSRSAIVIAVALFSIGLNLWAIPRWGWRGAAATSAASQLLLLLCVWTSLLLSSRREAAASV